MAGQAQALEEKVGTPIFRKDSNSGVYENLPNDITSKYQEISKKFDKVRKSYSFLKLKTLNKKDKETLASYKTDLLGLMFNSSMQLRDGYLTSEIAKLYSSIDQFIYNTESTAPKNRAYN